MKITGPACLVAALFLLTGCAARPQESQRNVVAHPEAEPGMACGTVGNIILKFPTEYTFLGVTYEGVDYWGGKRHLNKTKWCDDRLREVTLSMAWPELKPAGGVSWYTSQDPRFITISVDANNTDSPRGVMALRLESEAGYGLTHAVPRARDEIEAASTWVDSLGLHMVDANTFSPNNRKRAYWSESEDGAVSMLIVCQANVVTGASRCSQKSFDRKRNVWLDLNYRVALLPNWRALHESSVGLIDRLTVKHKEEQ